MVNSPIILFDGDCMVCNFFVRYVFNHDGGYFTFVSAQSEKGQELATEFDLPGFQNNETVYYIKNDVVQTHSTAIALILRYCGTGAHLLSKLMLLCPRFLRDSLYKAFALVRKKIIPPSCMLLSPSEKERVIL